MDIARGARNATSSAYRRRTAGDDCGAPAAKHVARTRSWLITSGPLSLRLRPTVSFKACGTNPFRWPSAVSLCGANASHVEVDGCPSPLMLQPIAALRDLTPAAAVHRRGLPATRHPAARGKGEGGAWLPRSSMTLIIFADSLSRRGRLNTTDPQGKSSWRRRTGAGGGRWGRAPAERAASFIRSFLCSWTRRGLRRPSRPLPW